ncbi:MAG: hypothetical protein KAR47_05700 [Planctomycetes bacterium]|nr:hypothetical protein [Planctomycetota bacterium]
MNIKTIVVWMLCAGVLCGFAGCKGGSSADEGTPLAEVQTEAQGMDTDQLKDMALKYKDAILAKKDEMTGVADQLKEIPIAEMLGEEAKSLQTEIETLGQSVQALTERFQVYYNKLVEMKGDVSGLEP